MQRPRMAPMTYCINSASSTSPTGRRNRSAAANGSGWPWPARWRSSPACCCSTSRCPRSTSRPGKRCAPCCSGCWPSWQIPAAHVTHDRDEALSLGDDLAVIVGGQLRQTGPAATVASEPADPDIARLLGWSELGHGTAAGGTVQIGQLVFRDTAEGPHGPVQAFYRPEDVELRPTTPDEPADGSLTAPVERIIRTRPLARITLGCDPPIAALMLHRDINRLQLTAGNPVQVNMPPGGLRVFRARREP